MVYDGAGGATYCAGLAVRKVDEVTDRGANAVKALCAGLGIPAPFVWLAERTAGLKEGGGAFADGGGRGGNEEGGCGFEVALRPGGGGRAMMNGCAEEKVYTISDVPNDCQSAVATAAVAQVKLVMLERQYSVQPRGLVKAAGRAERNKTV